MSGAAKGALIEPILGWMHEYYGAAA